MDYSIIIPAYNEENYLLETILSVKNSMFCIAEFTGEIIVVDNNSTDKTREIAEQNRVKIVFEPINQISRSRNRGAQSAQGKYLIFIDADTVMTPELLRKTIYNLDSGSVCGGGAKVSFGRSVPLWGRIFMYIWTKLNLAAGCYVYCLHEGFENIGGFSEKVYAGEEFWFSLYLTSWGKKKNMKFKLILDPPVITSDRKLKDLNKYRIFSTIFLMIIFPFATRFKKFCKIWYKR